MLPWQRYRFRREDPSGKRTPSKQRFFERATPNQLWQNDILTFRLGSWNAYMIGFTDDYGRFLTGLGLFRNQTAEHVLEVYRRALGEYGVPREMLTDKGRHYTNWRGSTQVGIHPMRGWGFTPYHAARPCPRVLRRQLSKAMAGDNARAIAQQKQSSKGGSACRRQPSCWSCWV